MQGAGVGKPRVVQPYEKLNASLSSTKLFSSEIAELSSLLSNFGGHISQVCEPVAPGLSGISNWETTNFPCLLPADLKALYQVSNGWLVEWSIESHPSASKIQGGVTNINNRLQNQLKLSEGLSPPISGRLCISPLSELTRVSPTEFVPESDDEDLVCEVRRAPGRAMFILNSFKNQKDNNNNNTKNINEALIALVYAHDHSIRNSNISEPAIELGSKLSAPAVDALPFVMMRDFAGGWHYVAPNVTCYIRLQLAHLGIQHWQFRHVKDVGLPSSTKFWLKVMAPCMLGPCSGHGTIREQENKQDMDARPVTGR